MESTWTRVDREIIAPLGMRDEVLDAALEGSERAGLPAIAVTPSQGKHLMLLAKMVGARRILEIGTLGGYSTIWLARGLSPGGRVVTLELEERHATVARENIGRAGLAGCVEVLVGPAMTTLKQLAGAAVSEPFDLTFIDANKDQSPEYFDWAVRHSRAGAVVVVDNVIRNGEVLDAVSTDERLRGTRRLFERVAADSRVEATAVQTVGEKGYDGMLLAMVRVDRV